MKANYALLLLISCAIRTAKGQDTKAINKFSLEYGIHLFSRQDEVFSPMVYHDASPVNLGLTYSNENEKRLHFSEVSFTLYDAQWHDPYDFLTGFDEIKTVTTLPSGFT